MTERHFRNLCYLLLVLLFAYVFFVLTEYLTVGYKLRIEELHLFTLLLMGKAAPWFWFFFVSAFIVPGFLLLFQKGSTILRVTTAGVLINLAMWVKRFVIVIPTLEVPLMPFTFGTYSPTWVEISIVAAGLAGFMLILAVFAKIMPLMPFVEMKEEVENEV